MIKASQVSMGFLRSLYYEQVQKSIADAKEKRAREVHEQAKSDRQRDLSLRRRISDAKRKGHIRPIETQRRPVSSPQPPSDISAEDFVDALEEME